MADILKISTPLVDRNQMAHQGKPVVDPTAHFQMTETSKVVKPNPQSELLQQNNGMPTREESPAILMNLLRDPDVTVGFLRNIYLLQEIINLIPANNQAFTQEIGQIFNQLMVSPEDIAGELARQEDTATLFRGELFDMLRNLLVETPKPEMRFAAANLLKSLNAIVARPEILRSLANNLSFLSESLEPAKTLSQRLAQLSEAFHSPDAAKQFPQLKGETLQLLREIEGSILFTPKLSKIVSMVTYNLSRFSDNPDYIQDTVNALLSQLEEGRQNELMEKLNLFLKNLPDRSSASMQDDKPLRPEDSKVMDALTKLLDMEKGEEQLTLASSEKLEKIIHSLLSSPCNYTPLLHFIVPVEQDGLRSFAEMWLDPDSDEARSPQGDPGMHMLAVFDVEQVGQFEAELFITGKRISLNLLCPPNHAEHFKSLSAFAARMMSGTGYTPGEVYVGELHRPHSLIEVFKTLPHRRSGIDVKI